MSRSRNIKPGFFKNDVLAECPISTRLLFIGLWCEADREGRLEYRPKRIKAACMPYDDINVEDAVAELIERGFLHLYESGGPQYLQVVNWSKHQNPHHKEVASVIPAPSGHVDTVCTGYVPLNNGIRKRIYERDGRVCRECGAEHGLSIDHIVPVSRGGNSTDENLQVLCLTCNARKGNRFSCISHEKPIHKSSMDDPRGKPDASCSTDSLIPDSLEKLPPTAGAEAPPEADPIFGTGLDFLRRKGLPERPARSFLGLLRKEIRDDLTVAELLVEAERQDVSDPQSWLTKAAKQRKRDSGETDGNRKSGRKPSAVEQVENAIRERRAREAGKQFVLGAG